MTITCGMLQEHIRHRIGGPVAPEIGGNLAIVNLAGEWVYSVHQWRGASRLSASLAFVAGQEWMDAPAGFAELIEADTTTTLGYPVVKCDIAEMMILRDRFPAGFLPYRVAVETTDDGERIAVYPTPSSNVADGITITYRIRWTPLSLPSDVATLPRYLEPLLIEAVREYAYGREAGNVDTALEAVERGTIMRASLSTDGAAQPQLGYMRGGAVGSSRYDPDGWLFWMRDAISRPV